MAKEALREADSKRAAAKTNDDHGPDLHEHKAVPKPTEAQKKPEAQAKPDVQAKPADHTHDGKPVANNKLNADTDLSSIANSKILKTALTAGLSMAFPGALGLLGSAEKLLTGGDRKPQADARAAEAGKDAGPVKHDKLGRVSEVDYPDGTKRTFGYDDKGQLNRMTQPTGETFVRKGTGPNAAWEMENPPTYSNRPGIQNFGVNGNKVAAATEMHQPRAEKGSDKGKAADAKPADAKSVDSNAKTYAEQADKPNAVAGKEPTRSDGAGTGKSDGNTVPEKKPKGGDAQPVNSDKQPRGGMDMFAAPKLFDVKVAPDGTVSYRNGDGSNITTRVDNSSTRSREGFVVETRGDGKVTDMRFANGDKSHVNYDGKGEITDYSLNDKNFRVINHKVYDSEGNDTGQRNPSVTPWGGISTFDQAGNATMRNFDGGSNTYNLDGSSVTKNADGQVTKVINSDQTSRTFTYDEHGHLNALTDAEGKVYEFKASVDFAGIRWGEFKSSDGSKLDNVSIDDKGVLRYHKDGKIIEDHPGAYTSKTTLNAGELMGKAVDINQSNWVGSTNSQITKTLEGMSSTDRVALDNEYKRMFGESLTDKLKGQMWNPIKDDATGKALSSLADAHLKEEIAQQFSSERDSSDLNVANRLLTAFDERARKQGLTPQEIAAGKENAVKSLEGAANKDRTSALDKAFADASPTVESLRAKYGVQIEEGVGAGGAKVNRLSVDLGDGKRLDIGSSSSENPRDIERQLKNWQENKMKELEREFPVKISRDGDTEKIFDHTPGKGGLSTLADGLLDITGIKDAPDNPFGESVALKTPRVDQLVGLEMGLRTSAASVRTADNLGTKVLFPIEDSREQALAYYMGKDGKRDSIVFDPSNDGVVGTRGVAIHEWFHNSQYVAGTEDKQSLDKFYADMGFRLVEGRWQLKDKDGNYYAQASDQGVFGDWTRVDDKGRPLRADGSLAVGWRDAGANRLSNSEMRDRASVRPSSDYFPDPGEESADAIRGLRDSQASRQQLLEADRNLYNAAKTYDQRELDRSPRFGKNPDGTSKFIRLPDTSIVLNNAANRKTVADFESSVIAGAAAKSVASDQNHAAPKGPRLKRQAG